MFLFIYLPEIYLSTTNLFIIYPSIYLYTFILLIVLNLYLSTILLNSGKKRNRFTPVKTHDVFVSYHFYFIFLFFNFFSSPILLSFHLPPPLRVHCPNNWGESGRGRSGGRSGREEGKVEEVEV